MSVYLLLSILPTAALFDNYTLQSSLPTAHCYHMQYVCQHYRYASVCCPCSGAAAALSENSGMQPNASKEAAALQQVPRPQKAVQQAPRLPKAVQQTRPSNALQQPFRSSIGSHSNKGMQQQQQQTLQLEVASAATATAHDSGRVQAATDRASQDRPTACKSRSRQAHASRASGSLVQQREDLSTINMQQLAIGKAATVQQQTEESKCAKVLTAKQHRGRSCGPSRTAAAGSASACGDQQCLQDIVVTALGHKQGQLAHHMEATEGTCPGGQSLDAKRGSLAKAAQKGKKTKGALRPAAVSPVSAQTHVQAKLSLMSQMDGDSAQALSTLCLSGIGQN